MNFPFFNHVWQAMGSNWDDFDACFESGFPASGQATHHNVTDIETIMVNCNAQVQAVINSAQAAIPVPSTQSQSTQSQPEVIVTEGIVQNTDVSQGDTDYITKSEVDEQIVMWVECVTEQVLKTGETTTADVKKLVDTAKAEVVAELATLTAECLKLETLARDLMVLPGVAAEIERIKAERAEKWRKDADERAAKWRREAEERAEKWRQTPYAGFDGPSLPDENAYPNEISLIDPYSGVRYHLGEPEYGKRVFSWAGEAVVLSGFMCAHDDEHPTHYIVSLENGIIERFPKDRYTIEYIGTDWFMFDTQHGSYINGQLVYGNHSNDIRHSNIITTEFDECSREFEKVLAGTSDTIVNFKRWRPLQDTVHMPAGTTVIVVNSATARSYLLRMKFGDDGAKQKVIDVAFVSLNENLIWLAAHDLNSAIRLKVDNLHARCMMFGLRVNNPACTFKIVPGHTYVRR